MARERVIALVDMDCFYVQVEQRLNPSLYGKPCAVVQYNHWKGGGIIAVGYEARKFGVTRGMRGDEAQEKCPDIVLARVPEARGKADLTRYREAGAEVINVLQTFCDICERASVDEAYLDLTEQVKRSLESVTVENLAEETIECSHVIGFTKKNTSDSECHDLKGRWLAALSDEHNRRLAMGALIVQKAREAIKEKTGFTCSAGIAHNKVMAKLAGGSHKPNQQTILPHQSVATFFETIPIGKVRYFGGKFGKNVVSVLRVEKMSELTKFSEQQLRNCFGEKSGSWLYNVCRGVEHEAVISRQLAKSTGCGKNFTGKMKLISKEKVSYWMLQLAEELNDRLKGEENRNQRRATLVSVGLRTENHTSGVRSFPLKTSDPQSVCDSAMQVIKAFNSGTGDVWYPAIVSLHISASKFEDISKCQGSSSIASFFCKKELTSNTSCGLNETDSLKSTLSCQEINKASQKLPIDLIATEDTAESHITSCVSTLKTNEQTASFNYDRDEIDPSIVDELPEDLKNEMLAFLGFSQNISEKKKRRPNGIEKYTSQGTSSCVLETDETPVNNKVPIDPTDTIIAGGDGEINSENNKIQCCQCSLKLSPTKMTEHLDFHFAMALQKNDQVSESLGKTSPPKKRQKSRIDCFFIAKDK